MDNSEQYLTVTALTQYIKRKFDVDPYLGHVYLTGEISNFRLRPNAHQYFSLKDDKAKISAIMFKSAFSKVKFKPEEGMKVRVKGRISLYEQTGAYQIYVESMEPDGLGALYLAFEQLKKKLQKLGVFDMPKKPIPQFPKKIAIVTSESGAVIHDIMTTVSRRFPIVQLVLFPAQVQGDSAAATIVERLKQINDIGDFDTIIIGRGGGSIEDLWPFNEEIVAEVIVNSKIPVISSVGHETDTTIADLVADLRAATPTAAAELATPVLRDILQYIQDLNARMLVAQNKLLDDYRKQVKNYSENVFLQHPERIYEVYLQKVDNYKTRLMQVTTNHLNRMKEQLWNSENQLVSVSPRDQINKYNTRLSNDVQTMTLKVNRLINTQRNYYSKQVAALDSLSPLKTLSRGYAIATDASGKLLKQASDYKVDEKLNLRVLNGTVEVVTKNISEENDG
ncbi:exodeoxyribonuclease VII large subunit [Companilactobacillus ginsenosidimutans]|uniref:Exodeoxyribonuclease 7 large subunit n=1 Tax=Companilactobacillus ginsenosidimutans TaxID=1007676 RepID=A0A0H4QI53_9LACO|nr:exodeoxyribonuclease VII large subunit [Companilactobacillus ginsenosidimutans]AKP66721.1 exodeoxyribonuclease VII large subunit [Companilactobacillus ginsenosidimutans]